MESEETSPELHFPVPTGELSDEVVDAWRASPGASLVSVAELSKFMQWHGLNVDVDGSPEFTRKHQNVTMTVRGDGDVELGSSFKSFVLCPASCASTISPCLTPRPS